MGYFRELPDLQYQNFLSSSLSSHSYIKVKNLFRRNKLRDDLQNVFTIFDKYEIMEGARPDTIAEDFYGDSELDWVVLMTAGILNVRNEWPLSNRDLYEYAYEIYGNELNSVHHYENSDGIEVGRTASGATAVTNAEYELKNNDFAIDRIKNYYYFKINRWDLELANGKIIKFPPNITSQIIKQSSELLNHSDFKNYGVIDLRIHGKIVVE